MIQIKEVKAFKVGDKTFATKEEANEHLIRVKLIAWANKVGLCRGGEWSQLMIVDTILEHLDEIKDIFNESK